MLDATELQQLSNLYEQLRLKLLDLSKKNRMLNYSLGAKSRRHLQIIDEVLEEAYRKLVEAACPRGERCRVRVKLRLARSAPVIIQRQEWPRNRTHIGLATETLRHNRPSPWVCGIFRVGKIVRGRR